MGMFHYFHFFKILFKKNSLFFIYVKTHAIACVYGDQEGHFGGVLSFCHLFPGDGNQVARCGRAQLMVPSLPTE